MIRCWCLSAAVVQLVWSGGTPHGARMYRAWLPAVAHGCACPHCLTQPHATPSATNTLVANAHTWSPSMCRGRAPAAAASSISMQPAAGPHAAVAGSGGGAAGALALYHRDGRSSMTYAFHRRSTPPPLRTCLHTHHTHHTHTPHTPHVTHPSSAWGMPTRPQHVPHPCTVDGVSPHPAHQRHNAVPEINAKPVPSCPPRTALVPGAAGASWCGPLALLAACLPAMAPPCPTGAGVLGRLAPPPHTSASSWPLACAQPRLYDAAGCARPRTWSKPNLNSMQRDVARRCSTPLMHMGGLPPASELTEQAGGDTQLRPLAQQGPPPFKHTLLHPGHYLHSKLDQPHGCSNPTMHTSRNWLLQWMEEGTGPNPLQQADIAGIARQLADNTYNTNTELVKGIWRGGPQ